MSIGFHSMADEGSRRAFTLLELLVSMAVLVALIFMINQVFKSATTITTQGNKHMDADAQARAVLDRMSIDFSQIVKRPDVDYWLKDPANTFQTNGTNPGNDQLAFYSQVPGYFLSGGTGAAVQSPVSMVSYRIFGNQLQRYGCGLSWNGVTGTTPPMIFTGTSTSSGSNTNTIAINWPNATSAALTDPNYETIGPQVFRMEYYYLIQSGTNASVLSGNAPWDTRNPAHTSVNGLQDVAAISVAIAVIDPKSEVIVTPTQLSTLAATMEDFPTAGTTSGALESKWESAINSSSLPKAAASSIRVYRRDFYLPRK